MNPFWLDAFDLTTRALIVYFLISNFIFLLLLAASFVAVRRMIFLKPMIESIWRRMSDLGPNVSVIAPCYNEAQSISQSVRSFVDLDYPRHEVIVVNDGSSDATLEILKREFKLLPAKIFYDDRASRTPVRGVYRSQLFQNLIVVDKDNTGKADSINVGLGYSRSEVFCAVDADCLLDRDALLKVLLPFIEDPETTVASGGTIRPVNGSVLRARRPPIPRLPWNPFVLFQIVEYLRAFLFGRVGWNLLNGTLIISGAFGTFKRQPVMEVGGYQKDSVGEDMELVLRLRKWGADQDIPVTVAFIPDPICWTEVPSDPISLGRQRDRWQRGLADSLFRHRRMFLNSRYGVSGMLSFPVYVVCEFFQPVFELLGYGIVIGGYMAGLVSWDLFVLFFLVDIFFGVLMSFGAVLIEESAFHKYPKISQLFVLLIASVFENIGYRQYVMFWRLVGTFRYFLGATHWGKIERRGFSNS